MSNSDLFPEPAYDVAPTIMVVDREIVLMGPGAVAFSMTHDAATEMLRRLAAVLGARIIDGPSDQAD